MRAGTASHETQCRVRPAHGRNAGHGHRCWGTRSRATPTRSPWGGTAARWVTSETRTSYPSPGSCLIEHRCRRALSPGLIPASPSGCRCPGPDPATSLGGAALAPGSAASTAMSHRSTLLTRRRVCVPFPAHGAPGQPDASSEASSSAPPFSTGHRSPGGAHVRTAPPGGAPARPARHDDRAVLVGRPPVPAAADRRAPCGAGGRVPSPLRACRNVDR